MFTETEERNLRILEKISRGFIFREVGLDEDITKERVRQIVCKTWAKVNSGIPQRIPTKFLRDNLDLVIEKISEYRKSREYRKYSD